MGSHGSSYSEMSNAVKYCPECGNVLRNGEAFCTRCGNRVANVASNENRINADEEEKQSFWLNFVAFFGPIGGYITAACIKKEMPRRANGMIIWSSIGIGAAILLVAALISIYEIGFRAYEAENANSEVTTDSIVIDEESITEKKFNNIENEANIIDEEEFRNSCTDYSNIGYVNLTKYEDEYINEPIKINLDVDSVVSDSDRSQWSAHDKYNNQIVLEDYRNEGEKIIGGDSIVAYGIYLGEKQFTAMLDGSEAYIPVIRAYYIDFDENPRKRENENPLKEIEEYEFRNMCKEYSNIGYTNLTKNEDDYIYEPIKLSADVFSVVSDSDRSQWSTFDKNYHEIIIEDDRDGGEKIFEGDSIEVYGIYLGVRQYTKMSDGSEEYIPVVRAYYIDFK